MEPSHGHDLGDNCGASYIACLLFNRQFPRTSLPLLIFAVSYHVLHGMVPDLASFLLPTWPSISPPGDAGSSCHYSGRLGDGSSSSFFSQTSFSCANPPIRLVRAWWAAYLLGHLRLPTYLLLPTACRQAKQGRGLWLGTPAMNKHYPAQAWNTPTCSQDL